MSEMIKDCCTCEGTLKIYSTIVEFGYWDICSNCDKPIEDGFHYHDKPELY